MTAVQTPCAYGQLEPRCALPPLGTVRWPALIDQVRTPNTSELDTVGCVNWHARVFEGPVLPAAPWVIVTVRGRRGRSGPRSARPGRHGGALPDGRSRGPGRSPGRGAGGRDYAGRPRGRQSRGCRTGAGWCTAGL